MSPKAGLAFLAVLPLSTLLRADVVLNFTGGALFGSSESTPLADGRLVYAVTSTDNIFGSPVVGSFTSGDDVLLGTWAIDSSVGAPGAFDVSLTGINFTAGIAAGQQIAIYWFEALNFGASAPTGGEKYGLYTDPSWVIPADGSNVTISLETASIGGSIPDSATVTNLVVAAVPEPSSAAALAGLAVSAFITTRRRRSR